MLSRQAMKCFLLLLPLVHGFWCETSNRTGCRGQSRHFVRETSVTNPFLAFRDIEVNFLEEPIVVDWDNDGDLDVIVRSTEELKLFEFKSDSSHFVQVQPSPFKGILRSKGGDWWSSCRPAVVDWNGDGRLDLIIGSEDGIKYYEKGNDGLLHEKADNPFEVVPTLQNACTDLAVADWDGNGKLDLLVSHCCGSSRPLQHYENSDGQLVLMDNSTGPFQSVERTTRTKRPLMADWNSDGRIDLILMAKAIDTQTATNSRDPELCRIEVHLQGADGRASANDSAPMVLSNFFCSNFDGSGISLVDVDQDGDLDAILGANQGPLHVYENTGSELRAPAVASVSSGPIPLDQIQLDTSEPLNYFRPVLADWDLDGDLDLAMIKPIISDEDRSAYFEHQADGMVLKLSGPPNISCPLDWSKLFSYVDFDGDGKKDLVGLDTGLDVIICIQTSSGFISSDQNPFKRPYNILSCWNCPSHFVSVEPRSFIDWDSDGDLDMLGIYVNNQVYLYEQLSNGSFLPQPLPVPAAHDYTAADFDGDGDVDFMMVKANEGSCLYFERRSDGSLDQLHGTDNPFNSVCDVLSGKTAELSISRGTLSTLDDWNGDSEMDIILVSQNKVSLWISRPLRTFVEVVGSEQPFTQIPLLASTAVSLVDVDGDGRLDVVVPPQVFDRGLHHDYETYLYFQQWASGQIAKQIGSSNPFGKMDKTVHFSSTIWHRIKSLFVDLDGDGDLDLVDANLHYTRNDGDGSFTDMGPEDPSNPFHGIDDSDFSYWTLVDWDGDQALDLVQAYKPQQILQHLFWMIEVRNEMERNGTSKEEIQAFGQRELSPQMRFYRQVRNASSGNIKFLELTGSANPFHDMSGKTMLANSVSPGVVDLDGDGDLDLVLGTTSGELLYYEQQDGKFREPAANPFAELSIYIKDPYPVQPRFVDWDGDGAVDLVVTGTDKVQYFQRGVCMPSSPYCRSGSCNKETSTCKCSDGAQGEDCSLCGDFHVRKQGMCQPCPGFGDLSSFTGTCNRRGVCHDDDDARAQQIASNQTGFKVTSATGSGQCKCSPPFFGDGCEQGSCAPGQRLIQDVRADKKYPVWDVCVPCQSGRFKNVSGNQDCSFCPPGRIPEQGVRCVPCGAGTIPSAKNRSECRPCDVGSVATPGAPACSPCQAGHIPEQGDRCVPCGAGTVPSAKNRSECRPCDVGSVAVPGAPVCSPCQAGHIPEQGDRCIPCGAGTIPSTKNRSECRPCDVGFVAVPGAPACSPCPAGTSPSADNSSCVACQDGAVARPRSGQCTMCHEGSVPESSKSECRPCEDQSYAVEGDETCKPCTFPAMILNDDNWCTYLYFVVFSLAFLLFMLLVLAVFGRLRLQCLKRRLNMLVATKSWPELHATQTTLLEYGLWKNKACATVQDRKLQVKKTSFQLGISLQYVFEHLEDVYKEKAEQAEWRLDTWGPVTKSGFFVKVRNCGLQVDPEAAWNALQPCDYPENPNFHQVAGVLAYGPWALGKHQCCPRDGLPDCSIVDALQAESNSARATWFLSWVWGYHFTTVRKALTRWWEKHRIVSGAGEDASGQGTYIWWCVFVNNQFRMLEAGQVEDPGDLFNVFGQQLEGIGKMLMCLDQMRGSSYTTRIWCIFEVFVACQRSIPTTVILPELEVDAIDTLKDLTQQCRVDAEKAKASVEADAEAIKMHIQQEHKSFEYVNQTVEQALWCEVIKFLEQSEQSEQSENGKTQSIVPSTETVSDRPSTGDILSSKGSKTFDGTKSQCSIQ